MADGQRELDFAELIATVRDTHAGERRDTALRRLEPLIVQMARRVSQQFGVGQSISQSFIDDAVGDLLLPRLTTEKSRFDEFDPAKGNFPAWLHAVLKNLLRDRLRLERRRRHIGQQPSTGDDAEDLLAQLAESANDSASSVDWNREFSNDDLDRIEKWHVRDRFVLLVGGNLWHKVPTTQRHNWCGEWGVAATVPSQAVLDEEEPEDRLRRLAAETGENWLALRQHWYRKRKWLLNLDFVLGTSDG